MTQPAHSRFTFAEYVRLEETSNVKHEYSGGLILAMAGGTPEHAALTAAIIGLLFAGLRGRPCRIYDSDLRVRVAATGLATYPDVTIVCGPREHDPEDPNTVINPLLLVEVLSPSTDAYDRGEKFSHYRRIASLREVVFVAHDRRRIERWCREPDGAWTASAAGSGEQLELSSLGIFLDVDEVYDSAADPSS